MTFLVHDGPNTPSLKDPATLPPRPTAGQTVQQTLAMAWRATKKMRRNPEQFADVTVMPVVFTAMFAFIFGGAISGSVADYLPTIIPGVLAMTALTACMATGTQLREDMDKGVFNRFKSLPISRMAPLAGPMLADVIRYGAATALTIATGLAMGYRPGGGTIGVIGGGCLVVFAACSLSWIFAWLGTVARSSQAVQGIGMMVLFPLTFLSNAFVPAETLPGWLEAFVAVNPMSHVVTAVRDLMNHATVTSSVLWAVGGCLAVVAVFAPMAVRNYARRM